MKPTKTVFKSLLLCSVITLVSCSENNEEAITLAKDFFASLSDTTGVLPKQYYPDYIKATSDSITIIESAIVNRNDTTIVPCVNMYINKEGEDRKDTISLFITKDEDGKLFIADSKGFVDFSSIVQFWRNLAEKCGTPLDSLGTDNNIRTLNRSIRNFAIKEIISLNSKYLKNLEIKKWNVSTNPYIGVSGDITCKNNNDMPMKVFLLYSYYDKSGNFYGDDFNVITNFSAGSTRDILYYSHSIKNPKVIKAFFSTGVNLEHLLKIDNLRVKYKEFNQKIDGIKSLKQLAEYYSQGIEYFNSSNFEELYGLAVIIDEEYSEATDQEKKEYDDWVSSLDKKKSYILSLLPDICKYYSNKNQRETIRICNELNFKQGVTIFPKH